MKFKNQLHTIIVSFQLIFVKLSQIPIVYGRQKNLQEALSEAGLILCVTRLSSL